MTNEDKLFLQALQSLSKMNRENPDNQQSMTVAKDGLSDDLLEVFGIESGALGAWCFNVYVEFAPMYSTQPAKEWQTV